MTTGYSKDKQAVMRRAEITESKNDSEKSKNKYSMYAIKAIKRVSAEIEIWSIVLGIDP